MAKKLPLHVHKSIWIPALCLCIATAAIAVATLLPRKQAANPESQNVITYSTDQPSESKPDTQNDTFNVAPGKPRIITIPSIGANGFIQQVGIDQHQAIAVPSNVHMAGWYVDSKLPGDPGLSIIDGHLDGYSTGGIFENLAQLTAGATFSVGFGDMSERTFTVLKVQTVPITEVSTLLFSQEPGVESQLNLVTCGGTYNTAQKQYDKRTVVIAARTDN